MSFYDRLDFNRDFKYDYEMGVSDIQYLISNWDDPVIQDQIGGEPDIQDFIDFNDKLEPIKSHTIILKNTCNNLPEGSCGDSISIVEGENIQSCIPNPNYNSCIAKDDGNTDEILYCSNTYTTSNVCDPSRCDIQTNGYACIPNPSLIEEYKCIDGFNYDASIESCSKTCSPPSDLENYNINGIPYDRIDLQNLLTSDITINRVTDVELKSKLDELDDINNLFTCTDGYHSTSFTDKKLLLCNINGTNSTIYPPCQESICQDIGLEFDSSSSTYSNDKYIFEPLSAADESPNYSINNFNIILSCNTGFYGNPLVKSCNNNGGNLDIDDNFDCKPLNTNISESDCPGNFLEAHNGRCNINLTTLGPDLSSCPSDHGEYVEDGIKKCYKPLEPQTTYNQLDLTCPDGYILELPRDNSCRMGSTANDYLVCHNNGLHVITTSTSTGTSCQSLNICDTSTQYISELPIEIPSSELPSDIPSGISDKFYSTDTLCGTTTICNESDSGIIQYVDDDVQYGNIGTRETGTDRTCNELSDLYNNNDFINNINNITDDRLLDTINNIPNPQIYFGLNTSSLSGCNANEYSIVDNVVPDWNNKNESVSICLPTQEAIDSAGTSNELTNLYKSCEDDETCDNTSCEFTDFRVNMLDKIMNTEVSEVSDDEFLVNIKNRECIPLTQCDANTEYESTGPSNSTINGITFNTSDRVCLPLHICSDSQYESVQPTYNTNRSCDDIQCILPTDYSNYLFTIDNAPVDTATFTYQDIDNSSVVCNTNYQYYSIINSVNCPIECYTNEDLSSTDCRGCNYNPDTDYLEGTDIELGPVVQKVNNGEALELTNKNIIVEKCSRPTSDTGTLVNDSFSILGCFQKTDISKDLSIIDNLDIIKIGIRTEPGYIVYESDPSNLQGSSPVRYKKNIIYIEVPGKDSSNMFISNPGIFTFMLKNNLLTSSPNINASFFIKNTSSQDYETRTNRGYYDIIGNSINISYQTETIDDFGINTNQKIYKFSDSARTIDNPGLEKVYIKYLLKDGILPGDITDSTYRFEISELYIKENITDPQISANDVTVEVILDDKLKVPLKLNNTSGELQFFGKDDFINQTSDHNEIYCKSVPPNIKRPCDFDSTEMNVTAGLVENINSPNNIAMSDNIIIFIDANASDNFYFYIYQKIRDNWQSPQMIVIPGELSDTTDGNVRSFGESIAISNDENTIFVGCRGVSLGIGCIFVYEKQSDFFVNTGIIYGSRAPPDGGFDNVIGKSISTYNNTLVSNVLSSTNLDTSSSYSINVYTKSGNNWNSINIRLPGANNLGDSVSISGDTILTNSSDNNGSVYFIIKNPDSASQWNSPSAIKFENPNPGNYTNFGENLQIVEDSAVVSAVESSNSNGIVIIYEKNNYQNQWIQKQVISNSLFGITPISFSNIISLSLSKTLLAVGDQDQNKFNLFEKNDITGFWRGVLEEVRPTTSDGSDPGNFGIKISIIEDSVLVATSGLKHYKYDLTCVQPEGCSIPPVTPGYIIQRTGSTNTPTISCDPTGYYSTGTPGYQSNCDLNGNYIFYGCNDIICAEPTSIPTGVIILDVDKNLYKNNFNVQLDCDEALGYIRNIANNPDGQQQAISCINNLEPYEVPNICHRVKCGDTDSLGSNFSCPDGHIFNQQNAERECSDSTCTEEECCIRPTCNNIDGLSTTFDCNVNGILKDTPEPIECASTDCTVSECCFTPTCGNTDGDDTNFDCTGVGFASDSNTVCPEYSCTDDVCCQQYTCSNSDNGNPVVCSDPPGNDPDYASMTSSTPLGQSVCCQQFIPRCGNAEGDGNPYTCTSGFVFDSNTVCPEYPCTDDDCCQQYTCNNSDGSGNRVVCSNFGKQDLLDYDTIISSSSLDETNCCFTPICGDTDGDGNPYTCTSGYFDILDSDKVCTGDSCTDDVCCRPYTCSNSDGSGNSVVCSDFGKEQHHYYDSMESLMPLDQTNCCYTFTCTNSNGYGARIDCNNGKIEVPNYNVMESNNRLYGDDCCFTPTCGNPDGNNIQFDCTSGGFASNPNTVCTGLSCDDTQCCEEYTCSNSDGDGTQIYCSHYGMTTKSDSTSFRSDTPIIDHNDCCEPYTCGNIDGTHSGTQFDCTGDGLQNLNLDTECGGYGCSHDECCYEPPIRWIPRQTTTQYLNRDTDPSLNTCDEICRDKGLTCNPDLALQVNDESSFQAAWEQVGVDIPDDCNYFAREYQILPNYNMNTNTCSYSISEDTSRHCTGQYTHNDLCPCEVPTTCSGFDCSDSDFNLVDSPESVTCSGSNCTEQECCTVPPRIP
ncbi:MAG: hypothetical protein CMP61_11385, partial [Flavobacteriales bacterium]|nr:hypothetical protein [Flavobacteriales bacterium]